MDFLPLEQLGSAGLMGAAIASSTGLLYRERASGAGLFLGVK